MGLGFLTFSLPHFLVGPYRAENPENNVCGVMNNETMLDCSTDANIKRGMEDLSWNVWFFFVAQLLHGIGDYEVVLELSLDLIFDLNFIVELGFRRITALHPRSNLYRRKCFKENVICVFR